MSLSISSSTPVQTPQKSKPVETTEATRGGQDVGNDGDKDDGSTTKPASAPQAYTNALGQLTGTQLSVKA